LANVQSLYILAEVLLEEVTTIWCQFQSFITQVSIYVEVTHQSLSCKFVVQLHILETIANWNVLVHVLLLISEYCNIQLHVIEVFIHAWALQGLEAVFGLNAGIFILELLALVNKAPCTIFQSPAE